MDLFSAVLFINLLSLQLLHPTFGTSNAIRHWEDLAIVEAAAASTTAEALVVPLAAKGLDVLANHWQLAPLALGGAPLRPLGLAVDTPRIAVLLNVRHAFLKRVAAFGAEEMTIVKMVTEGNNVISQDGRRTGLAAGSKQFVPVQVAEEPQARVAVLSHGLTRLLGQGLASGTTGNAIESRGAEGIRFRGDL